MKSLNIIFMGTPEYSVPYLEALIPSEFKPIAVVTRNDKPSGRRSAIESSPVKECAMRNGIQVLQPENTNTHETAEAIRALHPDLIVVVAFGQIISSEILDIPKYGCINVHPSLLPKYRGPSPRQAPILNGDTETGVTIMLMDEKMDHGPTLAQQSFSLDPLETYESLCEKTIRAGVPLLLRTLHGWINKTIIPKEQDHETATYTKLLTKESGRIEWLKSVDEIDRMVRALNPWPGTWTEWRGESVKILAAHPLVVELPIIRSVGIFEQRNKKLLTISCGSGSLAIDLLQLPGKKPMDGQSFINGYFR